MNKKTLSLVTVITAMLAAGCGGSTTSSKKPTGTSSIVGTSTGGHTSVENDPDCPEGYHTVLTAPAIPARVLPSDMGLSPVSEYRGAFSSDATTFDYLANYHQSNSEYYANFVDNLLEHDQYGQIRGALAEKAYYNADCTRLRFVLRKGVKWVTSTGVEYAEITSDDFKASLQHLLDAKGGAENLAYSIVGAKEYADGTETNFDNVGINIIDDYTFEYILKESVPYFHTFFEYTTFLPLNRDFFIGMGGGFGEEWAPAECDFGIPTEPRDLLYCGPYILTGYTKGQKLTMVKNTSYWDLGNVNIDTISYTYNSGTDAQALVDMFMNNEISSLGVGEANYDMVVAAGLEDCIFEQGVGTTTFYYNWNLNRQTYSVGDCKSGKEKNEAAKANTRKAIANENFRKAVLSSIPKTEANAKVDGNTLADVCIRNTYTTPEFVSTTEEANTGNATHPAGSRYVEMVNREMKAQNVKNNDNYAKYASVYNKVTGKETSGDELTTFEDREGSYYNEDTAKELRNKAKTELQAEGVTFPVHIDYLTYGASETALAQANLIKAKIESTLGADFITFNLQSTSNLQNYETSQYQAPTGADMNFDLSSGVGWGPDYGDPSTFLHTFAWEGDMYNVLGFDSKDKAVYDSVLGDYQALYEAAAAETNTSLRYAKFAACEAELLASGVIMPNTTDGGGQAVSRTMSRTNQRCFYGTDDSRFKYIILVDKAITSEQRQMFLDSWKQEYDAAFAG